MNLNKLAPFKGNIYENSQQIWW